MNIATSADGYVARPDGNLDWLTERPAPKGFYGLPEFERSTDAKILGRKTFDRSLQMGARFSAPAVHYVFGSFLDEDAIDEFIITVVPVFIGEGIPFLAPRHRAVRLRLLGVQQAPDGVVQLHYEVQRSRV